MSVGSLLACCRYQLRTGTWHRRWLHSRRWRLFLFVCLIVQQQQQQQQQQQHIQIHIQMFFLISPDFWNEKRVSKSGTSSIARSFKSIWQDDLYQKPVVVTKKSFSVQILDLHPWISSNINLQCRKWRENGLQNT